MDEKKNNEKRVSKNSFLGMRIHNAVICIVCALGLPALLLVLLLI